jgi:hypothetical protein
MNKVQVKGKCTYCNGEAYLFLRNATSNLGEPYAQHEPCGHCQGSGEVLKWITLDMLTLLASSFEEDELTTERMEDENDW